MKLGTFVGQKGIQITEGEKKYVEDIIREELGSRWPDYTLEWTSESDLLSVALITIPSMMGAGQCYRNGNGDLLQPDYVALKFGHDLGYDEAVWGPTYARKKEGEPTLDLDSYHFSMDVMGSERGYRRRTVYEHVGIGYTGYNYGTELPDLEVAQSVWKLSSMLKGWRRQKADWQLSEE